jgi:hypothetical protein
MASTEEGREHELAELLREVRALRETIDELKAGPGLQPKLPPNYEVLVRAPQPALPPDYAVAVRQAFPPTYAVAAVTHALPPDYAVLVRAQMPFVRVVNPHVQAPVYAVAVQPGLPEFEEPPIVE